MDDVMLVLDFFKQSRRLLAKDQIKIFKQLENIESKIEKEGFK
jgi:hypothetical protein